MAWSLLGRFGDESDVQRIERTTKSGFSGTLSHDEYDSVRSMIRALAPMCRRHVAGSCELLVEMQLPSYWKDTDFRLFDDPMPLRGPFEYELIGEVMRSYARSGKPDLEARAEAVMRSITDPVVKEIMAVQLDAEVLRNGTRSISHQSNDFFSDADLWILTASFNGDLNDPRPSQP
jgi:hypothetical protein